MKITYEDYSEETGEMTVSFPVDEWMSNPGGLMQGMSLRLRLTLLLGIIRLLWRGKGYCHDKSQHSVS